MTYALFMILVVTGVTQVTRWLPFWLFSGKKTPAWVESLGKRLPPAIMAALVIYCLKGVPEGSFSDGVAALISVLAVAVTQWFKKSTLLSIAVGTALYMLLIRLF